MKRLFIIILFLLPLNLIAPAGSDYLVIPESKALFDYNELSWAGIDYWMRIYEVREPEIAKRQIKHETGNLKSRICKQDNNLFGMKWPRKRKTTAIGRDKMMSVYSRWQDSILDYQIWQDYFYKGGDYYSFLKSHGYATDKRYVDKLKTINQ